MFVDEVSFLINPNHTFGKIVEVLNNTIFNKAIISVESFNDYLDD